MQMDPVFENDGCLFWYEPIDLFPTTHVFSEELFCGPMDSILLLYLCNSFDDFKTMVRNNGPLVGASDYQIEVVWNELNDHAFMESPGLTRAGFEVHGNILENLANVDNQKLMLDMLTLYCEDENWQDALGPEPAEVKPRIDERHALVIPGDEDLIALAVNLYNKGAYNEI